MKQIINTERGVFQYNFPVIYEGVKVMNQEIGRDNLLIFKRLADKAGLRFSLAYGTLLGAIREHGFIPHDEDIDLAILQEDIETFKNLLWDLREEGFEVMRFDRRNSLCSIIRKGEYIDIYIFRKLCDGVREFNGEAILEKYLTDLEEIDFQGSKFLIAREAADFCLFEYGENWQTPIAMKPYDMAWYQKKLSQLFWWLHFNLPSSIFRIWMQRKGDKKINVFNLKVERYNNNKGKHIYDTIPKGRYLLDDY